MHFFKAYLSFAIAALCLPFVLMAQPTISSFTPITGKPGDVVTLTGTNFNTTAANNVVFFGATRATVTAATANSVTLTVPIGATYAPITLLNTGTGLAAASLSNFTPTYAPAKSTIGTSDFLPNVDFGTGQNPQSVAIGDIDGDGKPDLAVANSGSNTVSVFRNTAASGSTSFVTKVDFVTGGNPQSVTIGDVDGDGKPDLAVANTGTSTVSVLRNTATSGSITASSFATSVDFPAGPAPRSVAIGDVDGDGKPDLVVARNSTNAVSVLRNTATSGSIDPSSFALNVDFVTGIAPVSVAIGDIDGDGKPDLATANYIGNTVSVLRNTATNGSITASSFAKAVDFGTGLVPYSVAIGDIDGDGRPDLALTNYGNSTVSVLRNTSASGSITASSFAPKEDFGIGANPFSVAIGDVDGDGKLDLATANYGSGTVSVLRNTATSGSIVASSFATKVDFGTAIDPISVAIGDVDGDGKPDLATANFFGNTVSVLRNQSVALISFNANGGSGTMANQTIAIGASANLTANAFTRTGYSFAGWNTVAAGSGTAFAEGASYTMGAADVTLYAQWTANTLTVTYDSQGGSAIASGTTTTGGVLSNPGTPTRAGYTFNGWFMAATGGTAIAFPYTHGQTANFTLYAQWALAPPIPIITSFSPASAKPGDVVTLTGNNFNTTAANNIVFFGATRATVTAATATTVTATVPFGATYAYITLLNAGTGLSASSISNFTPAYSPAKTALTATDFLPNVDFSTGQNPYPVAIGDLDGDGRPDLAVANSNSSSVSVFRNVSSVGSIGAGSFAAGQDFTTGANPNSIAIGDLDGDGKPDLAITNYSSNTVSVFRNISVTGNLGAGSFAARQDFATGPSPGPLVIGDLDGDGKPDLAVVNQSSDSISVLRNTSSIGTLGAGSFAARQAFATSTNPRSIAIGDLDGDSKPDLAVVNFSMSTMSVFRNTSSTGSIGTGSFASKQDFETGSLPSSVAIGDLDGDGKADLAVANQMARTVSVFRNISSAGSINAGSFAARQDFVTGMFPFSVAIGDLNGDGKPDLALANQGSKSVSVYRNTSTTGSIGAGSFAPRQDFTTGSTPSLLAIGDLDGDGKPDMVVAKGTANIVSVLRNADVVYTFIGAGNWDNPTNWAGNIVPPSTVPAHVHIVVDPAGSGECILNVPVTVPSSSSITVAPGKKFTILGNLTITQEMNGLF